MEPNEVNEIKAEARAQGKDPKTRLLLIVVFILWFLTTTGLVAFWMNNAFKEKEKSQTLAQRISVACESNLLGPGFSQEDIDVLCDSAQKVIENDSPSQIGPRGPVGPPGRDGKDGSDGRDGRDGKNGRNGQDGQFGDPGSNGLNGRDGIDGVNGQDGAPGPKGDKGDKGDPGVVNFTSVGCEGPMITGIETSYDPSTQTLTITCKTGILE